MDSTTTSPSPLSSTLSALSPPLRSRSRKRSRTPSPLSSTLSTLSPPLRSRSRKRSRTHGGACAACKFQRRRCTPDCLLAAAFPADRELRFSNAHHLFGVRNIERIVEGVDPPLRAKALETIIFQSETRAKDPVRGCYGIIQDLEAEFERCCIERALVRSQTAICRQQQAMAEVAPPIPTVPVYGPYQQQAMAEVAPPIPSIPVPDPYQHAMAEVAPPIATVSVADPYDDIDLDIDLDGIVDLEADVAPVVPSVPVHDPCDDPEEMEGMHQMLADFEAEAKGWDNSVLIF